MKQQQEETVSCLSEISVFSLTCESEKRIVVNEKLRAMPKALNKALAK